MTVLKIILIVLGVLLLYLLLARIVRKVRPMPAPPFIGWLLDSSFRRWMQPASKVVERSGIRPGMTVLDLGCGSGAYTFYVAEVVGGQGLVYAVDIQPAMLRQLVSKLARSKHQGIKKIELKRASAYDLPFKDGFFDLVYMVTVLPEIPDRARALQEVKRVLKAGGILAVTEFLPDPDYPLRSATIKVGQSQGFVLDGAAGNLWNYTVRFVKPASDRLSI